MQRVYARAAYRALAEKRRRDLDRFVQLMSIGDRHLKELPFQNLLDRRDRLCAAPSYGHIGKKRDKENYGQRSELRAIRGAEHKSKTAKPDGREEESAVDQRAVFI